MNIEELQEKLEQLASSIDWIKTKLFDLQEEKGLAPVKTPYEVEAPADIEDYLTNTPLGREVLLMNYLQEDRRDVYIRGLAFKNRKELEQHDKERILLFKMHKWAEEYNEGWYPDWEDCDDKYYIAYNHGAECFQVASEWRVNIFYKLPYFKSEELAREFAEEFGDEIKEVLFQW